MLYRTGLKYNKLNNLIKFQEQAGNSSYATEYNYDKDDRTTKIAFQSGSTIRGVEYVYDKVNRVGSVKRGAATITKVSGKKDKVIAVTENAALGTTYAFMAGDTTYGTQATTPLVAGITHGTSEEILRFVYDYDNTGNITTEWQGDIGTHYGYDALGQLIRVVSPFEADVEGNPSLWEYDYDRGGNMLEKRRYRYIYNAQGEQVKSDLLERRVYTYGDSNWKDKLTAYDGKPITYDAIGNPLTYDGWTYTWQAGRQLSSMAKSGTNASFKYDASGLRTQKTVNGVVTDYTLHGKLVTGLKQGANIMHFFYDKDSRPQMVAYNGTLYTYVHNLQGAIASIVDNVGTKVVEYKYDVWGKPIGAPWTLTIAYEALATLNPFRYRGYVYDTETGLYYLRSRYYNPDWGRFINSDSLLSEGILTNNTFIYCQNAPVNLTDTNGTNPFSSFFTGLEDSFMNWIDETNRRGWEAWDNPSPYTIGDYLTGGLISQTDKAWHPEVPFGKEHWLDSFSAAFGWRTLGFSAYSASGGVSIFDASTSSLANASTYGYGTNFSEAFARPTPQEVANSVAKWLGDAKGPIVKLSGDFTLVSKDGSRLFMSHLKHPQPHLSSHVHVNEIINGSVMESRIYPIDIPHM